MPGMASTSLQPHPPPRALTLSQSLFPPPEPWTPRTFTFNLSKLEILSQGETKPDTWTQIDGQSSLRFSIAARPYKVTLVRTCTGEKDEELLAWNAEDFIAIRLLVENLPGDSSQSIVTLTIQNRDKLLVDMIFDLRASKDPSAFGYKMHNLAHLQDRLKEISIEYRIRHKISMKGAYPIPVPGEDPIIRPKTPPNYKPGDSSTYILYPERPTASKPSTSTANGKGKGKEKEKENGLNGVRKQFGKKGKSKVDKKKGEEENTDESEYKGESDEEKDGKGGKTKSRVVRKKGKEKAVIEIVTNGKGNGSKKLGGKGKKPETQSNGRGGRKGSVTKKVKPGYEIETVTEDDTTEYEEDEDGSDNRSTTSKKRKGKVEPPVVTSPRGRVRRQSTVAKKVSYVEKGENSFEEDEDSGDTRRGKGDEEDSDSENDRLPSAGKRRRRQSSSSTQPPNRSRPRTMSPDPLPAPVASTSRHFELSPEAAETIDPLKRQLASHETRLDALSSFVYSPNRGGSLAGGVEEGVTGEGFDWLNGDSDLGWEENMKFLKSGYTDMRAKMKVYATEIQQLKVATEAIAVDGGKGKGKEREVDGDVDMDPDSTPQGSISILQNRIDALETSYSGLKTLLETSYSNLSETLETLQASTTSAFARIEELGNRNADLEKEREESRREEGKKRNEIKLLERRREEERKREAEERQEIKDEMRRLREDVNRLTGQATINPQDVFGTSGPASNLYNAPASAPWQSQLEQSNLGGAAASHREQPTSPFQQPFSLPTLPHDSDSSSPPDGSNRSSKRIANAPDTELSRRRRAASVGAPRVQADSTAPRTVSRRSGGGRGRGRASATPGPSRTPRVTRSKTVDPLALSSDYDEPSTSSHKQPSKKLQAIPPRSVRTRLSAASQPAIPSFESAPPSSIPQQSSSTSERSPTKVSAEEEQIYDQLAGLVDRMNPEEAVLFKLAQGARNELWNMEEEEA